MSILKVKVCFLDVEDLYDNNFKYLKQEMEEVLR